MRHSPRTHRLIKAASKHRVVWLVLFALIICLWYLAPSSSRHSDQSSTLSLGQSSTLSLDQRDTLSLSQSNALSLGQEREPQQLDIVLAHVGESQELFQSRLKIVLELPVIARLNPRIIVYTKARLKTLQTDRETLRKQLGADLLYVLPNIGRDPDSHLAHIIERYDQLADHTLFLQANIEYTDLVEPMLQTHFRPTLGVMGLGTYTTCPCDRCLAQISGNPDPIHGFKRIPQLYNIFNQGFCPPGGLLLGFKSQFIVSRARIIRNPKQKYVWLKGVYNDISHFIHDDPTEGQTIGISLAKKVDNPSFFHTLERSWMTIFGCSDVRIAEECDRDDPTTRCACYDDEKESVQIKGVEDMNTG
jgi:hypothetical protein